MNKLSETDLLKKLQQMMQQLRDKKQGCEWCQQQTLASLTKHTIEEAYELTAAIRSNNDAAIKDELADLLLQLLFYTQIGTEQQRFNLADVAQTLINKLERRNPHVFANHSTSGIENIKKQWHSIKATERKQNQQHSLLDNIPTTLPATIRSEKIQSRAAEVNFDWETSAQIIDVLKEEIVELQQAKEQNDRQAIIAEFGDILFTCVNLARHLDTTVEDALHLSNQKFIRRFQHIEQSLKAEQKTFKELNFEELLAYWNLAKKDELMMTEDLAVIDLDLGAKLVGNDKEMAKELLTMLINSLPEHLIEINQAYQTNNLEELRKAVHKLHGATCYTGTPRLKAAAAELEHATKNQQTQEISTLVKNLHDEIDALLNTNF